MNHRLSLFLTTIALITLSAPIAWFGWSTWQRPPQKDLERVLFQGVQYQRKFRHQSRPVMIHVVTVDLAAKGVRLLVTPGQSRSIEWETNAQTTSEFLQQFNLQVAVNASFFHPFDEKTPWDYYPRSGDRTGVVGQAISNEVEYSAPLDAWPVLCISSKQEAKILLQTRCPADTSQAVAGSTVLVSDGQIPAEVRSWDAEGAYSRTAIAVDKTGKKLRLILVDDKQWLYSEGVTLSELANLAIGLGADAAINLDGGGSTTLVTQTPIGSQVLNAPVHTKIPMRERPVANHLGIYALPLPQLARTD